MLFRSYYKKCHIVIAPLRQGAGIKIKVLEALTCGIDVVATGVGGEGITHPQLHIVNNEIDFANKICELFRFITEKCG